MRAVLVILFVLVWAVSTGAARADVLRIDTAQLILDEGSRMVALPHTLRQPDFDPAGSVVTFRLTFELPAAPEGLYAIYIPKLSLSARLFNGGHFVWACGDEDLVNLRCLHRPQMIVLPEGVLQAGTNVFDLEVYADGRQMNGLTEVYVGDYLTISHDYFVPARFLKVDLIRLLATFAAMAGILSLATGLAVSRERIYLVFGLTALFEAAASFVILAVDPPGDRALVSWMVFTVRFVGIPMKLLLFYEAFGRLNRRDRVVQAFVAMMVVGPVLIALTDSDRSVVIALYALILLGITITMVRLILWTRADPSWAKLTWTAAAIVIFVSGVHDYMRVGGLATLNGVYLLYYVFPLVIVVMSAALFAKMGQGLRVAQDFNEALRHEVGRRTADLESALASIRNMEDSALRLTRNIPFGTFILHSWGTAQSRFVFVSDRLRQMIDVPVGQVASELDLIATRLHPEDDWIHHTVVLPAVAANRRVEVECRLRANGGAWRWLRIIMIPQPDSTVPAIWDGVVIDVTDAREAEERLRIANAGLVEAAARESREAERARLLQDMHDGFGSQLSSARLAIEHGNITPAEVGRILLECSEDLRIMVDALGNEDGDLADALADFRHRTDRRFSGTGITVGWDIDIPPDLRMPPATILQILRILQEAKNNALRHSGARHLQVAVRVAGGRLTASVSDDGKGMGEVQTGGRGLANMRKRCREIGATLSLTDAGPGLCVTVAMDLPDAV